MRASPLGIQNCDAFKLHERDSTRDSICPGVSSNGSPIFVCPSRKGEWDLNIFKLLKKSPSVNLKAVTDTYKMVNFIGFLLKKGFQKVNSNEVKAHSYHTNKICHLKIMKIERSAVQSS